MTGVPPTLIARNLRHAYGSGERAVTVLDGVSLDLYAGEVALLMGPSGSGKTTLLAALSTLLEPDGGEVVALGQDLTRLTGAGKEEFRRLHFGFVFQGSNLFPGLTARQQLEMVLCWGGAMSMEEARPVVAEALEGLGLTRQADSYPEELSSGEKQRVAVGRALIKRPALCFADEPTSALDWERGEQVVRLLREAARGGTAVLVVSHDPRLIPLCDRVFHLRDGRLGDGPGP